MSRFVDAALQPKDPEPHISAALLLEKQKDYVGAEKEYQVVLTLDPQSSETAVALTNIYMKSQRLAEAAALHAGGVDVFWMETMSALEEVEAAVEGVRRAAPEMPIIVTMSFDTHGHTMMGVSPEQAAKELGALGAVAVGGNCGLGPAELLPAMVAMRAAAPDAVLVAKPNAGLPVLEGDRAVYRGSPEEMADYARRLTAAGVRIVGGCCGSAPEHLRAMASALGVTS
jgi:methionine synthase I (cobalamin-dependent)